MPINAKPTFRPNCGLAKAKCQFVDALERITRAQIRDDLDVGFGVVPRFEGLQFFDRFSPTRLPTLALLREINSLGLQQGFDTIQATGDIHGDMLAFLGVLFEAGFIDAKGEYTADMEGQRRCFLALGDVLDRGGRGEVSRDTSNNPREEVNIIEFAYWLNQVADSHGDRVVLLTGNHEYAMLHQSLTPTEKNSRSDSHASPATKCPFQGVSRWRLFGQPNVARYFAACRPVAVTAPGSWFFAHGDLEAGVVRAFLQTEPRLMKVMGRHGPLPALARCANLLWAAWVLSIAGEPSVGQRLAKNWIDSEELRKKLQRTNKDKLRIAKLPKALLFGRTLASINQIENTTARASSCASALDPLQELLGVRWAQGEGGIALGHTLQPEVTALCNKRLFLLDIGQSEGFAGVNQTPLAFLQVELGKGGRVAYTEVNGRTGVKREVVVRERYTV
jgi:hypothetical protein